ncbi:MAG: UvrD-helicase domain-containing protein, partial [Bacteroidota bacterium]|nr:UvrD-helicase domain-containing protein [Bacteroidota bacterium]
MRELTQFQKAALNTKQHIALTANAGSGKTTILCKRYLDILLESNVHVKDIAAITFTDKAASELYDAVTGEIADRLSELKLSKSAANKEEINQINYTIVRLENI